jgi:hypothetical protein
MLDAYQQFILGVGMVYILGKKSYGYLQDFRKRKIRNLKQKEHSLMCKTNLFNIFIGFPEIGHVAINFEHPFVLFMCSSYSLKNKIIGFGNKSEIFEVFFLTTKNTFACTSLRNLHAIARHTTAHDAVPT